MTAADLPIPGEWILQGGAGGLLVLVVLMVLTGRLIPRSMYQALAQDRDYWRTAALKSGDQVDDLRVQGKITTESLQHLSEIVRIEDALAGRIPKEEAR